MATRGQFGTVGHPVLESTWPIPTPNEVDLYRLQSNLWRVCYPFEAIQRPILCWWQRTKRGGASKVWNLVSWYQQRRRCEGVLGEKRHYRGVPLRAGSATETLSLTHQRSLVTGSWTSLKYLLSLVLLHLKFSSWFHALPQSLETNQTFHNYAVKPSLRGSQITTRGGEGSSHLHMDGDTPS